MSKTSKKASDIKFTGKSIRTKHYMDGSLVTHDDVCYIVWFDENGHDIWVEVEEETVRQLVKVEGEKNDKS